MVLSFERYIARVVANLNNNSQFIDDARSFKEEQPGGQHRVNAGSTPCGASLTTPKDAV